MPLIERGPALPIGVLGPDGQVHQQFAVRPWKMKEERILGKRRAESDKAGGNLGSYIAIVLSTMCTSLGGHDWAELKDDAPERQLVVSQMWMPDVFYAYCWLRLKALGNIVPLKLRSPYNNQQFEFKADLKTLEVEVPETLEACHWVYELQEPINVRGKTVTKLTLGPQRWSYLEQLQDPNLATAKAAVIAASIRYIPEVASSESGKPIEIVIADQELDEMSKADIEALAAGIEAHGVGPIMTVTAVCPATKREFEAAIDWRYDNFFGTGSR